jgi:hypothetical protein
VFVVCDAKIDCFEQESKTGTDLIKNSFLTAKTISY